MRAKIPRLVFAMLVTMLALSLTACPDPNGSGDGDTTGDTTGAPDDTVSVPGLHVAQWINEPTAGVDRGADGHVYFVEFWATWCGYCVECIPHLNEIHRLFGDLVTVIGVTDQDADHVQGFVDSMGESMQYAVAIDDNKQTWNAYMGAYGLGGIPHAFVVVDGEVVDHFHPANANVGRLDDYIDAALIAERDAGREPVSVSGQVRYNGQPITDATAAAVELDLWDELFSRRVYPTVTGAAYSFTDLPRGSYSLHAEAGDEFGGGYDPGNFVGSEGGLLFSGDGTHDVDMIYMIRLTAPHDNSGLFAYPQTLPAGTVDITWDLVPGASDYYWYCYEDGVRTYGYTDTLQHQLVVTAGKEYQFDVWARDAAGTQIGNLYVLTETSSGYESRYGTLYFQGVE